jgi:hypothetical protein
MTSTYSPMQDKITNMETTSTGKGLKINRKKAELVKIIPLPKHPSQ